MDSTNNANSFGIPAPYGMACKECSRGKYKCIYGIEKRICERCQRLGKDCVRSVSVRKLTNKRVQPSRTTNIRYLEEKIETLTNLLRKQQSEGRHTRAVQDVTTREPPQLLNSERMRDELPNGEEAATAHQNAGAPDLTVNTPSISQRDGLIAQDTLLRPDNRLDKPCLLTSPVEPDVLCAEERLSFFKQHMLTICPVMYISEQMNAKQLRETSPFLWFNIMTTTSQPASQQRVMSDTIKRFVAQKIVVDNERNVDMLLGLLVFICWSHFHRTDRSYITIMASLAMSLVSDMGLNKPHAEPAIAQCVNDKAPLVPPSRSLVEKRAVLACFLLTSRAAFGQKKIDALRWTSYMDECLQVVASSQEWPGDAQLAAQVRIQLIIEQSSQGLSVTSEIPYSTSYFEALLVQVEKIKMQFLFSVNQNNHVISQIIYAELIIQEMAIGKGSRITYSPNFQRHQLLNKQLANIVQWFDLFFAIPPELFTFMTFSYWFNMVHCLTTLYRLYVLDDPAWDRAVVHNRTDLFSLCERVAAVLDSIAESRMEKQQSTKDIFALFAKVIRSMCATWLVEVQAADWKHNDTNINQRPQVQQSGQSAGGDAMVAGEFAEDDMAAFTSIPGLMANDDMWLQDFFSV